MNTHRDGLARSVQTRLARHAKAIIRAEDAYGGQRVTLDATLGAARLRVQVDVGIGDAVVPPASWLDYPSLAEIRRFLEGPLTSARQKVSS